MTIRRRRRWPMAPARARDLVARPASIEDVLGSMLPYAVDVARGTVTFAGYRDAAALAAAPFLYHEQWRQATSAATVSLDALEQATRARRDAFFARFRRSGLLLSTGRCASTAACAALRAMGTRLVLSEPDVVLAPAEALAGGHAISADALRALCYALLAPLHAELGGDVWVIKPRSFAVLDPTLAEAFPEAALLMMYREPLGYLASAMRVFSPRGSELWVYDVLHRAGLLETLRWDRLRDALLPTQLLGAVPGELLAEGPAGLLLAGWLAAIRELARTRERWPERTTVLGYRDLRWDAFARALDLPPAAASDDDAQAGTPGARSVGRRWSLARHPALARRLEALAGPLGGHEAATLPELAETFGYQSVRRARSGHFRS